MHPLVEAEQARDRSVARAQAEYAKRVAKAYADFERAREQAAERYRRDTTPAMSGYNAQVAELERAI